MVDNQERVKNEPPTEGWFDNNKGIYFESKHV